MKDPKLVIHEADKPVYQVEKLPLSSEAQHKVEKLQARTQNWFESCKDLRTKLETAVAQRPYSHSDYLIHKIPLSRLNTLRKRIQALLK